MTVAQLGYGVKCLQSGIAAMCCSEELYVESHVHYGTLAWGDIWQTVTNIWVEVPAK
jgi:hypothetical protein